MAILNEYKNIHNSSLRVIVEFFVNHMKPTILITAILALLITSASAAFISFGLGSGPQSGDPTSGLISAASDGYVNWNMAGMKLIPLTASITGASGTTATLNVTYSPSLALGVGQVIGGTGIASGVTISAAMNDPSSNTLTGYGGTGTYTLTCTSSCANFSSEPMTATGIPNRCAGNGASCLSASLTPNGTNDTTQINSAISSCNPSTGKTVILLSLGVFKSSSAANNIAITNSGCTLRGSGPGSQTNTGIMPVGTGTAATSVSASCSVQTNPAIFTYCPDSTATQIIIFDRQLNTNGGVIGIANNYNMPGNAGTSYSLSTDAIKGAYSITLTTTPSLSPGQVVFLDQDSSTNPGSSPPINGGDSNYIYTSLTNSGSGIGNLDGYGLRPDFRIPADIMEVASVSGNIVTFDTPLTYAYHSANTAQLTTFSTPLVKGVGIENLFLWGGNNGNINISGCAYCWVKNVESTWAYGPNIYLLASFHNEIRDSFLHEMVAVHSGGGGYLIALDGGTSETLIENNISWLGDKPIVMRGGGSGNVVAYNYMMDTFNFDLPVAAEAGINAAHLVGTHVTLMEGNYSQNITVDAYWGNSPYGTFYRNWVTAHRDAAYQLATYTYLSGGCTLPYKDLESIVAISIQAYVGGSNIGSPGAPQNFLGNVLGMSGQTLPSNIPGCTNPVGSFQEQIWTTAQNTAAGNSYNMWTIGGFQNNYYGSSWVDTTVSDASTVRLDNWDFVTAAENCFATGGTSHVSCPGAALPSSFYLTSKPAFFGTHPWPWVDPTTGITSGGSDGISILLPAMYCFQQGKMPTCSLP